MDCGYEQTNYLSVARFLHDHIAVAGPGIGDPCRSGEDRTIANDGS